MRLVRLLTVAVGLTLMGMVPASASLTGVTIQTKYFYPDLTDLIDTANVVVGLGVELSGFPGSDPRTNIDLSSTNIFITYNSSSFWYPAEFNGLHFYDLYDGAPSITNVSINPVTNMVGLDASRISFDADNIWINWQGLDFWGDTGDSDTIVSLDLTFGEPVPEPATWMTLAAGLLGAAWLARRRRQRQ
jgi:hypothetical protein